jgi:hypothetical protein
VTSSQGENYTRDILVEVIRQSWDVIGEWDFGEPAGEHGQKMNVLYEVFPLTKIRTAITMKFLR